MAWRQLGELGSAGQGAAQEWPLQKAGGMQTLTAGVKWEVFSTHFVRAQTQSIKTRCLQLPLDNTHFKINYVIVSLPKKKKKK